MKAKQQALARSYRAALHRHVRGTPPAPLASARKLGQQAVKLGLETLDLARMHEEALKTLILDVDTQHRRDRLTGHAGIFFAEALTPIEETHRRALEASVHLKGIIETLASVGAAIDQMADVKPAAWLDNELHWMQHAPSRSLL